MGVFAKLLKMLVITFLVGTFVAALPVALPTTDASAQGGTCGNACFIPMVACKMGHLNNQQCFMLMCSQSDVSQTRSRKLLKAQ